jgi:ribonuclease P protein component
MLAKKYRLPIQTVLNKSGRSFKSSHFLFKSFFNKLKFNRFGVVISKKIDKRAAERNRLKRIFFDSVKNFIFTKNTENFDILVIILRNMTKLQKADIIKELNESLAKIIKS